MSALRAGFFVLFLAAAAYLNSLGNGFAYDDHGVITRNPVVTQGDWRGAFSTSWWQNPGEGGGLYRPLTTASFSLEWGLFSGSPLGFHALNVVFHALVSLLLFFLLLELGSIPGALAGGALFAVHPLHTEVVANVVGRAELFSAFFYLAACLLYVKGKQWKGWRRGLRLLALGVLYFLSLAGKEIGVTLPGALFLLEAFGPQDEKGEETPILRRIKGEAATYLFLTVVLTAYLGLRFLVLGTLSGEEGAPIFLLVGPEARVFTAVALWFQYLRLHVFPLDLSSDYDPGVLFPSEGLDGGVFLGLLVLLALAYITIRNYKTYPLICLGILWFAVSVLPVSNFLFPTGVLLAERTLYTPSMGLSLVAAGTVTWVFGLRRGVRQGVFAAALLLGLALFTRTVLRNPAWLNSIVVQETLNAEHPESWRVFRSGAQALRRAGNLTGAAEAWDQAVRLAPTQYVLLVQAGDFHARFGDWARGESYLREAVALAPGVVNPFQVLSAHLLTRGFGREGHRVAVEGLARAGPDQELWALVSESYILKGDLPAAARARRAAIALDPQAAEQWSRLAEILHSLGDQEGAADARARANALSTAGSDPSAGTGTSSEGGAP